MLTANDIAVRFDLKRHSRSWRGNCPACGYPRALAVGIGRNDVPFLFYANGCARDVLHNAVRRSAQGNFVPPGRPNPETENASRDRKKRAALKLWDGSVPMIGTLAEAYLAIRGLPNLADSAVLRFRSDCPHPEAGCWPAMIGLVADKDGEPVAVHRTYLDRATGHKSTLEPARASLGSVWGGAIRLHESDPNRPLVIGEGIESSASAGELLNGPAWSAISAGNLARGLVLPPAGCDVVIAADPDEQGERAAKAAALRWTREGRRVRIARPVGMGDFNDLIPPDRP